MVRRQNRDLCGSGCFLRPRFRRVSRSGRDPAPPPAEILALSLSVQVQRPTNKPPAEHRRGLASPFPEMLLPEAAHPRSHNRQPPFLSPQPRTQMSFGARVKRLAHELRPMSAARMFKRAALNLAFTRSPCVFSRQMSRPSSRQCTSLPGCASQPARQSQGLGGRRTHQIIGAVRCTPMNPGSLSLGASHSSHSLGFDRRWLLSTRSPHALCVWSGTRPTQRWFGKRNKGAPGQAAHAKSELRKKSPQPESLPPVPILYTFNARRRHLVRGAALLALFQVGLVLGFAPFFWYNMPALEDWQRGLFISFLVATAIGTLFAAGPAQRRYVATVTKTGHRLQITTSYFLTRHAARPQHRPHPNRHRPLPDHRSPHSRPAARCTAARLSSLLSAPRAPQHQDQRAPLGDHPLLALHEGSAGPRGPRRRGAYGARHAPDGDPRALLDRRQRAQADGPARAPRQRRPSRRGPGRAPGRPRARVMTQALGAGRHGRNDARRAAGAAARARRVAPHRAGRRRGRRRGAGQRSERQGRVSGRAVTLAHAKDVQLGLQHCV
jgi:hypothetical protein